MSTKKRAAEETVTSPPEETGQPELTEKQAERATEVQEEQRAEAERDEASLSTGQLCRVAFCSRLNLRKNPGMQAPVLQVLPAGTEILIDPLEWVAEGTGVWFPVTVDGVNGFVNGQYLSPVEV